MDDIRAQLDTSETSCSLFSSYVAGQPLSDGGRQGRSANLGYQCVMSHCIKGSWPVYGHTHGIFLQLLIVLVAGERFRFL